MPVLRLRGTLRDCICALAVTVASSHQPRTPKPMILSDTDRDTLLATLNSKKPEIVQARMANALLLLSEGLPVEDVAGLLYLDEATLAGWQKMFTARKPRAAA
jgi:hypothetical protein